MLVRLVWRYLRHHIPPVVAIVLLQILATIATLFLPELNARIINEGVVVGDTQTIWRIGGLMLGFSILEAVTRATAVVLSAITSMRLGRWIRQRQFERVQNFSSAQLSHFGPPSLITRATNDVDQVQTVTMMTFTIMASAPLMGVGAVVMALRQSVTMSGLLLVVVPLVGLIVGITMAKLQPLFKTQQKRLDRLNTSLREQLTGVRVVRAFVRQDTERVKYDTVNAALRNTTMLIGSLFAVMFTLAQIIIWFSQVAVIWFGGHLVDAGSMQVGSLIAFINYLVQIFMVVMMTGFIFMMVPRGQVCADRILEVLNTQPDLKEPAKPRPLPTPAQFALDNVCVKYPGARAAVFDDLTITFAPGTTTGIVGPTASGKSTVINLLPRLFDASGGAVTVNGHPVEEYALDDVRGRISVVPQKAYLFSGTIATTVAGTSNADHVDRDRVRWALEGAQAWEFVADLEDQLDAEVESGGQNFSGGQRQRLAIARALYKEADLYIFDDSLSALDSQTERRLRDGLSKYVSDAAVIIVSQKTSSIMNADQILVLGDKDDQDVGTHSELLERNQLYREIVQSQSREVAQ